MYLSIYVSIYQCILFTIRNKENKIFRLVNYTYQTTVPDGIPKIRWYREPEKAPSGLFIPQGPSREI